MANKSRMHFWDDCVAAALRGAGSSDSTPESCAKAATTAADACLKARDERVAFLLQHKPGAKPVQGKKAAAISATAKLKAVPVGLAPCDESDED